MHLRSLVVLGLCLWMTGSLLACGDDDHSPPPDFDGSVGDGSADGATDGGTDAQLDAGHDASDEDAEVDAGVDSSVEDAAVPEVPPIKGSETAMDSELGRSLAIDGDTIVIGAPGEAGGGGAYVFVRVNGSWLEQAHLHASNRDDNDRFGTSVSIEGDSIVVGAVGESSNATGVDGDGNDNSKPGSGAAYLFTRDTGVWTEQAYLKASNPDGNDNFGYSVAISGNTIAVSAHTEASDATGVNGNQGNSGQTLSGAVYVFASDNDAWSQQAYVKASNTDQFDRFGVSLDLDGDTLAVGAYYEGSAAGGINANQADDSAYQAGAVYVLTRDIDTWTQQAYIKASNVGGGDKFGGSVALEGDVLVVGATDESGLADDPVSNVATASGAAYVYMRDDTTWAETDYLKPSVSDVGDVFGTMVAIENGVIAVGAKDEDSAGVYPNADPLDNAAIDSGAAYLFEDTGDGYVQTHYIKASNTGEGDKFGTALGLNDTILVVGAFSERGSENNSPNEGAFYIYGL